MEEIVWSFRASKDAHIIYEYIAMDSKFHVNKWIEKIAARINILPKQPYIGRVIPERNNQNLREIIEGNYRIMYRISKGADNNIQDYTCCKKFQIINHCEA